MLSLAGYLHVLLDLQKQEDLEFPLTDENIKVVIMVSVIYIKNNCVHHPLMMVLQMVALQMVGMTEMDGEMRIWRCEAALKVVRNSEMNGGQAKVMGR